MNVIQCFMRVSSLIQDQEFSIIESRTLVSLIKVFKLESRFVATTRGSRFSSGSIKMQTKICFSEYRVEHGVKRVASHAFSI